ncbi:peptidoglycan D,D-transpeptidase FtsI family protein [Thiosulfativibrio zosterae]|uniref:Peptidoglycan D,D-transpeptidase FtsI n=1 Tax=Thiosulfativibrio zosterae TaxID=2675053 RepID=A0A6F8PLE2_9GAMM|nr:penicillin-binding protein 2 [Thiosulfativibrio zosterae]BBP42905.1 peptidoglycan synthetase FtsI [Thiosulfativibrio zosterae]
MSLYQANRRIKRDSVVFVMIAIIALLVLARAFYVQILQAEFLQSEGDKRQIRTLEIPAARGTIFDRQGSVLALSTPMASVWCDPKVLAPYLDIQAHLSKGDLSVLVEHNEKEISRLKKQLANYQQVMSWLGLSANMVSQKVAGQPDRRFLYLKRSIQPTLAQKIDDLNIPGIYVENEYKRYYPGGETTAHLVGFTDIDGKGLSGVESTYHDWLTGQSGKKQVIKDRAGHVIDFVQDITEDKPGKDLVLSIDKDVQFFLERALKRAMIEHQAKAATAVVLDAKTGEILSMASLPAFNPNDRSQLTGEGIRNRVITDVVEPGSTVKPIVIAKALDLGLVSLDEEINTSPGSITIQGQRVTDPKDKGRLTPEQIIEKSSNVGMVKVAMRMKPEQLWQLYQDVGFAQDLGIFLPGESLGFMKRYSEWQKIEHASAAYGYGFNINLLQLAKAYTIFANDGQLVPLSILKKTQGNENALETRIQVVSPESAHEVLEMMEKVVGSHGTAPQAHIAGYRVAGKTGTAHKTKRGGYEENQYFAYFAGLVPVSDPRFIMVVAVNEPSRGIYYGGSVAAPIFKEVMTEVLRLYNVPTDIVKEVMNAPSL